MVQHYQGVYKTWPKRYFTGLDPSQKMKREQELLTRSLSQHPKLGKTDLLAKPRKSRWTQMFHGNSSRWPARQATTKRTGTANTRSPASSEHRAQYLAESPGSWLQADANFSSLQTGHCSHSGNLYPPSLPLLGCSSSGLFSGSTGAKRNPLTLRIF